jgi:hypothetical protein
LLLDDAEFGAKDLARTKVDSDLFSNLHECLGRFRLRINGGNWPTIVSALSKRRYERKLPEQRHFKFFGEFMATARTKEFIALAIITGKP